MKKLGILLIVFLMSANLFAQNANLVLFSQDGYPFKVILNGVLYNEQPQTNVKITNLNGALYSARIIFQDTSMGVINKNIQLKEGYEMTYAIKLKEIKQGEKFLKSTKVNLERQLTNKSKEQAAKEKADIEEENEKFVVRFFGESQLASTNTTPVNNQQVSNQKTQTTNQVAVEGNTNSASTRVSINGQPVNQSDVSMNVSIDANVSGGVTSSTTSTNQVTEVYQMPGYSGSVGCPWPLNEGDFANVKQTIASKSFDDTKLTIAKQVINSNCLLSRQVKEIMLLFSFEDTRLELAKYAYGHTYDISNYYLLNDAFDFESSIEELNDYINGYSW